MKKFFVIFSVLTIMALSKLTAFAISGEGTEESPFLITNQEELLLVTDFPSSHFKLVNDIVMSEEMPPLCFDSENRAFTGVVDGDGHTISNICVYNRVTYADSALFYRNIGTIKNLNIVIKNLDSTAKFGLAVFNEGYISNCCVEGQMKNGAILSGITYTNTGTIEKCEVNVDFEGSMEIAGIAYYNESNGMISQCKVGGTYSCSSSAETAGICFNNRAEIKDCYFNGALDGDTVAGISIGNYSSGSIKNCYAVADFGDATNIYPIGYKNAIENCYYDKTVSGLNSTTYGTPKSTTAMKMIQTYQTNWDFDIVWGIDENINNGYPYLLWEYAPTDNQITFDTETQKAKIYLKEAGTYTVIFADYNGTTFVKADIQPLTLKQGYNNIPTTLTLADGDKVFLWKDLKTLVPICEAANVSSK